MATKKRLLFIYGPLGGGGAERVLIDFLRNIDYTRFDVDLALIYKGGILLDEIPNDVNAIGLWKGYSLGYRLAYRISKWFRCNWFLARKMNGRKLRRDYDAEISFLEGMPLKLGALRNTNAKKITWVHADLFTHRYEEPQFYPGEEIRAYNKMDTVVNVSKDCEKAFVKRFPECTSRLAVIYNPIDRNKILAMAKKDDIDSNGNNHGKLLTIITVGRLTPQKKPERLLQLAHLSKKAGLPVRFIWVGDGELRSQMEDLRDKMGLSDIVEFKGFTKNPFPHIKNSDIMVVTSDFEGFCLVICEAMCLGVPVISTPTAGPCEIIGNSEYGAIADFSPESLFEVLKRWVENPDERMAIAAKSMSRPDIYSVENAICKLEKLIEE